MASAWSTRDSVLVSVRDMFSSSNDTPLTHIPCASVSVLKLQTLNQKKIFIGATSGIHAVLQVLS